MSRRRSSELRDIAQADFGEHSLFFNAGFKWKLHEAKEFFEGIRANGVKMLSSNGEVKRRGAAGEFAVGLTDTDDASVAMNKGKPVMMIYPDQDEAGTLIVPNAAVLIANGPNPDNGKKFIEYLLCGSFPGAGA